MRLWPALFCVWALAALTAAHKDTHSEAAVNSLQKAESCSRERSRLARAALNKLVLSVTSSTRAQLTPACPWHPERDLFAVQEQQKQRVHDTHWRCLSCQKSFSSEAFLDAHLSHRHGDRMPEGADVCLADFCDVLQCDAYAAAVSPAGAAAPARCSGARALQLARSRCLLLLDDCLPPASAHAGTWRAHQLLAQQHCGQLRDCHSTQALFRSERLSTTAWRFLERLTIGIVVVALLIYYASLLRQHGGAVRGTMAGAMQAMRGGRAKQRTRLGERAAVFLMGGKLGLRLAIASYIWEIWRRRTMGRQGGRKKAF